MKYTCADCGRSFVYAAKLTIEKAPLHKPFPIKSGVLEFHTCPYCGGIDFDEAKEQQPEIVSIKSVDIAEADDWIKKGYRVLDRYAKTVTLALEKGKEVS